MKAVYCTRYGSPEYLQIRTIAKPAPADNEILIRVYASSVTAADTMMRRAVPFFGRLFLGLFRPKQPVTGTGLAGEVEAVGKSVKTFQKGDPVFGETGVRFGANAEYVTLPADGVLALKPANLPWEEAAPVCDGPLTSLNFLKKLGGIKPGQKVLINGASGSLGTAAVQLAKHFSAHVTAVCSAANAGLVKSLGADEVIDYTTVDFTQTGKTYDIIFDTVGKSSYGQSKKALTASGTYLSPVLTLGLLFQMILTSKSRGKKAVFSATGLLPPPELNQMLQELLPLLESGQLKSVVDKRFPLEQAAEAHHYVDRGHKKGNVVLVAA